MALCDGATGIPAQSCIGEDSSVVVTVIMTETDSSSVLLYFLICRYIVKEKMQIGVVYDIFEKAIRERD